MVVTACSAKLDEVLFLMPPHPKCKRLRRGANTVVICIAAMPFPTVAMPPEDGDDALSYGLSFLTQSISRNPNWLKD